MPDELKNHLQANLKFLEGDWVKQNSGYENSICQLLGMMTNTGRYWDAKWNEHFLEFKKGRSIWLDLVRYSEILKKCNEDACQEVLSLFFIPDKEREKIIEILCVKTGLIIENLKLNEPYAETILELNKLVPRSLNAQASLTVADLRKIAQFIVK
jgi:hypothetical protein